MDDVVVVTAGESKRIDGHGWGRAHFRCPRRNVQLTGLPGNADGTQPCGNGDSRGFWAYPPGATVWGGSASGSGGLINRGADIFQYCQTGVAIKMPCNTGNNTQSVSRSEHSGGAHGLMTDGSVRFLNQNISATTYDNLRSIRDGQVVGEF